MREQLKTLTFIVVILGAVTALVLAQPRTRVTSEEPKKMPETYSIKTFLNPDWTIAMHEVFTHYLQAASNFGQGNYEMSIAFLRCMEYYVDFLPELIPDKTPPPESKKINKAEFKRHIAELKQNTIKLRKLVEMKDYKKATDIAPEIITKMCFDCHKKAQVPPKWQIGGYKIDE